MAVADEIAAAADLVKGKISRTPVAIVRGLAHLVDPSTAGGARRLVRTGPSDFFAMGHIEAARAALGVAPGSPLAETVGIRAIFSESIHDRLARAVRVALGTDGQLGAEPVRDRRLRRAGIRPCRGLHASRSTSTDDCAVGRAGRTHRSGALDRRWISPFTLHGPERVTGMGRQQAGARLEVALWSEGTDPLSPESGTLGRLDCASQRRRGLARAPGHTWGNEGRHGPGRGVPHDQRVTTSASADGSARVNRGPRRGRPGPPPRARRAWTR